MAAGTVFAIVHDDDAFVNLEVVGIRAINGRHYPNSNYIQFLHHQTCCSENTFNHLNVRVYFSKLFIRI